VTIGNKETWQEGTGFPMQSWNPDEEKPDNQIFQSDGKGTVDLAPYGLGQTWGKGDA